MDGMMNQLPCGVVLIDEAGHIAVINTTAEQQLAYEAGALVGQPFSQVLTIASRMLYQTHIYPLINLHGRTEEVILTMLTRTGERIPVLFNAVRQLREGHWLIYGVYLPLGQRHHYEAELIQARQTAEEAKRAVEASEAKYRALATELEARVVERTNELETANSDLTQLNADLTRSNENLQQFAYIASHDLQEPLRKIQSFGDLIKTRHADQLGEGVDYLSRMQAAASHMSTLVRDLLTYSRIATRRDTSQALLLIDVVNGVLADLEPTIQGTGAVVQVGELPRVLGDGSQLGQLFQNLLSNALKFTRPGVGPVIDISSRLVAAAQVPQRVMPGRLVTAYYCVDVADNGIGFDEKYLDRIFQVFQRLHGKNGIVGTGIGLAICEKVAANHGGAITASSQPGAGATFSVFLPA